MEVILESIPTGVISLDPDFRIHTLNRAARTMFSVTTATHLDDLFKGDDLAEIHALLADATENGITREISFRTPGRPAHSAVTASRLSRRRLRPRRRRPDRSRSRAESERVARRRATAGA